jgi:hypothetical protein
MAFEFGMYLLGAGQQTYIYYGWNGAYKGPQLASAVSYYASAYPDEYFVTTDPTVYHQGTAWGYRITVRNAGPGNAWFKVAGGGLT